jgi:methyl-accepting chemotaxis protein
MLIEEMIRSQDALKTRNENIQNQIRPMLQAIDEVSSITNERLKAIEKAVEQVTDSRQTFQQTSESVENIAEKARYMMDLIKIIDDISERINILSINASIESARAGAHGKGFGVIAGEVRKLADSTAENATQTGETLKQVVESIKVSRSSSQRSMETYNDINGEIVKLSESLDVIQKKMADLIDYSREIISLIES